jgi:hypothetical protein
LDLDYNIEDLFANPKGLTLQWREEHGNTFAPEIGRSTGFDGIPLKGEEIIGRYGQEKTSATGFIRHPAVKSHWWRVR